MQIPIRQLAFQEPQELLLGHKYQQRDLILLLMKAVGSCHSDDMSQRLEKNVCHIQEPVALADDIDTKHIEHYLPLVPLNCEIKCGGAALDVADRQNAHSATPAVKGVVWVYGL